jgi:hypothetical protein
MQFSILHISDLHRDLKDELANGPLLESLVRDIERYQKQAPPIFSPSLCVVSGDLVYGVSPRHSNPGAELDRQYTQAVEFLTSLTDACFDGDRERIVLIPGNHDVSYPTVIASSTRIDIPANSADKRALTDELWLPNTRLRWSWAELCFYRIHDPSLYEQRLAGFAKASSTDIAGSLRTRAPGSIENSSTTAVLQEQPVAWSGELTASTDIAGTLQRGGEGGRVDGVMTPQMAVRRLTPRECERLQGFPDDYTLVEYRGKLAADGPRYKALGNSMAVPVMRWIGERIAAVDAILRGGSGTGSVS